MEPHPEIGQGNGCRLTPSVPPVELDICMKGDTSPNEELLEASPPIQTVSRRKKFGRKKNKRTQEAASLPEICPEDKEEKEESEDGEDLLSLMDFLRTTSPTTARRDPMPPPTRAARSNSSTHAGKRIFSVFGRSKSEVVNGQHVEAFPYRGKWRRKERAKVNKAAATRERSNTMITPSLSSPSLGEVITRGRSTSCSADGMSYDIAKLCLSDSRLTAVHKDFPESPPAGEILSPTVVRSHMSKEAFDRANNSGNNNDNTINLREESMARVFHSAPILPGLTPRKRKKPKKTLSRTKQKHKQQRDKENNPNSPPRKVDSKEQLLKGLRLREEKGGGAVEYPVDELSLLEFVYLLEQEIIAEEELEGTCKDHEELQRQRQQLRDRGIWERSPSANSVTTTRQYDDNGYGGDNGTEEENAAHLLEEEGTSVGQAPDAICMDSTLLVSTPLQRV
ncbi:hypothetical protein QOT17_001052 [Balamuthia mandrillaris]